MEMETYLVWAVLCLSLLFALPGFCQFADLPRDEKMVDIGFSGDGASQTFTVTAVVPVAGMNGWVGVYSSRAASDEEVLSEIVKAHIQGGFRIGTFGIEAFSDLERNIAEGSALTSQIGMYVRPKIYERGRLRVSGGIGGFIENIQPRRGLILRRFDPTSFRWLAFSSVGWRKLNTQLKFTPEVGFQNFKLSAEPAITFDLSTRLGLRISGAVNYNSAPLTDRWHYKYLTILRITL